LTKCALCSSVTSGGHEGSELGVLVEVDMPPRVPGAVACSWYDSSAEMSRRSKRCIGQRARRLQRSVESVDFHPTTVETTAVSRAVATCALLRADC
jgi:hypothetical protein